MAVEKLILRSILYGADKIPDSWFDRIPGGFYKDAEGHTHLKSGSSGDSKVRTGNKDNGRRAEYRDFYSERQHVESSRRRDNDRGRSRSSYDGGVDDEEYEYGEDGRPVRVKSRRRQRSVDEDRYGYDDGHRGARGGERGRRAPREHHEERRSGQRSSYPRDSDQRRRRSSAYPDRPPPRLESPPTFIGTTARADGAHPLRSYSMPMPSQASPPQPQKCNISNGYVPYAHIYGNSSPSYSPQRASPEQSNYPAPPPTRTWSSPVVAMPQAHHPLSFSHQPTRLGGDYSGEPRMSPRDGRHSNRYEEHGDERFDDRRRSEFDRDGRPERSTTRSRRGNEYNPEWHPRVRYPDNLGARTATVPGPAATAL